ncbi:MAG: DUF1481 domain-containing protein [Symbiopectobacterium sp.]
MRYLFVRDHLRKIKRSYRVSIRKISIFDLLTTARCRLYQRQLDDRRKNVSDDEIALFQFDAKRMLELS